MSIVYVFSLFFFLFAFSLASELSFRAIYNEKKLFDLESRNGNCSIESGMISYIRRVVLEGSNIYFIRNNIPRKFAFQSSKQYVRTNEFV